MLDLVAAQAKRIDAQAKDIKSLWGEVKNLQHEKLRAEAKRDELSHKYSQLRLEAWLGLGRVAIVVLAVALVLWFKLPQLSEVLTDLPRGEPRGGTAAASAPDGSPAATRAK